MIKKREEERKERTGNNWREHKGARKTGRPTRRFSLLFVSEYYWPRAQGGGEISCQRLAEELAGAGHRVTVLTGRIIGKPAEKIPPATELHNGVRVLRRCTTGKSATSIHGNIGRLFFSSSARKEIELLCMKERYDIIHAFNITSIPSVARARVSIPKVAHVNSPAFFCPKGTLLQCSSSDHEGKECGVPCCNTSTFVPCMMHTRQFGRLKHSALIRYNPLAYAAIYNRYKDVSENRTVSAFSHFFAISAPFAQRLVMHGVPKERISVLYNIIDAPVVPARVPSQTPGAPRILFMGELVANKGPQVLVEALSMLSRILSQEGISYAASFYGDGPLKEELERLAGEENLPVSFYPPLPHKDIGRAFARADVFIFPSLVVEAFGRAVVEAQLAGVSVIASRIGGVVDSIDDGKTGLLFAPGNAKELKEKIVAFLKNKKQRDMMVVRAREQARKKHAAIAAIRDVVKKYKELVQQTKKNK